MIDLTDVNQTGGDKKITVQILSNSAFNPSSRAGIMPTLFRTLMIRPHNREVLCRRYASAHIHCRTA
ncbi:hypothetical protein FW800_03915 [Pseudomonas sp. 910_23]|uniref:Uncharacterized protein n=1 Tax=Pseudomonas synxantha TaxID=47883 RepID=A0A5D3GEB6_9PSED|nr:hypothetical protein [Pseudomonas sp. W2Aug9]MCK3829741.1 hypothetical protein [Pseudomonas fluorescens]MCK3840683.1 hypothetical protein [Pseudomonas sp. NCIMB 10586]MCK3843225.1 hypothetical protein [Pseudomonas sp. W15Feb34]MCK3851787.1 hypothetical protein [Pseudomonas sp. W2Jun17]MCK3861229.1 hypothetical protein [Pseudomonas sp. B329]TYK58510.1 hypothetical protein FXO26_09100 [Pseudomonas synxantha]